MESADKTVEVYQLRIWIRRISPQIWRRLLVRSDSSCDFIELMTSLAKHIMATE